MNPYDYLTPISETDRLRGSKQLVDDIMKSSINWSVIGERRIGKTSLLRVLESECKKNPDLVGIYCNPELILSENKTFATIRSILKGVDNAILTQRAREAKTLDDLNSIIEELDDVFYGDRKLVVLLDEFDDFRTSKDTTVHGFIRGLAQKSNVQFVLASFRDLSKFSKHPNSPFFNVFKVHRLGNIPLDEARKIIDQEGQYTHCFENSAIDKILEFSGGNPYLTTMVCHYLYEHPRYRHYFIPMEMEEAIKISKDMVQEVLQSPEITTVIDSFCRYGWTHLTPNEKIALLEDIPSIILEAKGYQRNGKLIGCYAWWREANKQKMIADIERAQKDNIPFIRDMLEKLFSRELKPSSIPDVYEIYMISSSGSLLQSFPDVRAQEHGDLVAEFIPITKQLVENEESRDALHNMIRDQFDVKRPLDDENPIHGVSFNDKTIFVIDLEEIVLVMMTSMEIPYDFSVSTKEALQQLKEENTELFTGLDWSSPPDMEKMIKTVIETVTKCRANLG